MGEIYATM
jgi:hypothetical protein